MNQIPDQFEAPLKRFRHGGYQLAFRDAYLVGAGAAAVGLVFALFVRSSPRQGATAEPPVPASV